MGADMSVAEGAGGVMCSSQISCINLHHGRVVPNSSVDVFFAGGAGELMGITSVFDHVPPKEYTVILDRNGLLIHRVYHRSSPTVHVRLGLMDFLIWLFSRARVLFWSSATQRNMTPLLRTVLSGTGVGPKEVMYFS